MRPAILAVLVALTALLPKAIAADPTVPRLDHAFLIILENHDYCQILAAPASTVPGECANGDNPNPATLAPHLNKLAAKNGVATSYFGTSHPSEPNYVALAGGNYFGIQDDNDYACPNGPSPNSVGCTSSSDLNAQNSTCNCDAIDYPNHTIYGDNLAQQIDNHGKSWKAYFQSLPAAGLTGNCYPSTSNCLYASKHNPFINFESVQDHDLNKIVPMEQFQDDLQANRVPDLSVLVPDQCHDMHGLSSCPNDNANITAADTYVQQLVDMIRGSRAWKQGLSAIFITVDEGNTNLGCCDAATPDGLAGGGGNVATIVVTNHDARHPDQDHDGFTDATPYNHYSLLATIEDGLGLGCVQNTCDTARVKPMTPLLRDP